MLQCHRRWSTLFWPPLPSQSKGALCVVHPRSWHALCGQPVGELWFNLSTVCVCALHVSCHDHVCGLHACSLQSCTVTTASVPAADGAACKLLPSPVWGNCLQLRATAWPCCEPWPPTAVSRLWNNLEFHIHPVATCRPIHGPCMHSRPH
jgi:hypothetical protein